MFRKTIMTLTLLIFANSNIAQAESLKLTSSSIAEGQQLNLEQVFEGFGCKGKNISPDLSWSGAPEGTKSFAITVYDPDAPTGSGWWHWFVFNIPANINSFAKGSSLPEGTITLKNDYGSTGFGGACPPQGEVHRYQFTIHALDKKLDLNSNVSNALAGFMVNAHSIESYTITAVYNR